MNEKDFLLIQLNSASHEVLSIEGSKLPTVKVMSMYEISNKDSYELDGETVGLPEIHRYMDARPEVFLREERCEHYEDIITSGENLDIIEIPYYNKESDDAEENYVKVRVAMTDKMWLEYLKVTENEDSLDESRLILESGILGFKRL